MVIKKTDASGLVCRLAVSYDSLLTKLNKIYRYKTGIKTALLAVDLLKIFWLKFKAPFKLWQSIIHLHSIPAFGQENASFRNVQHVQMASCKRTPYNALYTMCIGLKIVFQDKLVYEGIRRTSAEFEFARCNLLGVFEIPLNYWN